MSDHSSDHDDTRDSNRRPHDMDDRTQEIRREDPYRPPAAGSIGPARDAGRSDDTAVFDAPPAARDARASGSYPPAGGGYAPPSGGYRPAPAQQRPASAYGAPMLPADRGSGGFPAAIVGAVVATLIAVATSFGAYQILRNHSSIDSRKLPGFVTYRMDLLPWPSGGGSDLSTAFVVGVLIVLVITVLLMMAAAMSTRAGNGGFALFLAAWMTTVIAGGVARPVAGAIARQGSSPEAVWQTDLNVGVLWGVLFGWIAALVLLIVHAMRRKPVSR